MKIDLLQASLLPRRENLREKSEKIVSHIFSMIKMPGLQVFIQVIWKSKVTHLTTLN